MCVTAMVAGSVASAAMGSSAADKAADAQTEAAEKQVELSRDIFNEQKDMFAPFLGSGENALAALNFELGLGERPTFGGTPLDIEVIPGARQVVRQSAQPRRVTMAELRARGYQREAAETLLNRQQLGMALPDNIASILTPQTKTTPDRYKVGGKIFNSMDAAEAYANKNKTGGQAYGGYQKTPGYGFRLKQGLDATQASVGARHGLNSGATLKSLAEYGQNFASNEYGNYINRLRDMAGMGQSSAAMTATSGSNFANNANNAYANAGNAQAAGAIGQANAWTGGINNALGAWMYGKGQGIWGQ